METVGVIFMAMLSAIAAYFVVILIVMIISIIANWLIFKKAGQPGWASIVPIYFNVVQFKIIGLNPWLLLLYLIPFVNFIVMAVFGIMIPFRMAKSFGKDIGWGFGLLFLAPIFYLILAFGESKYVGPNGEVEGQTVTAKVVDGPNTEE